MFLILEGKNRMENNKLLKIENLKMHIKTYMGTVKAVDGVNIDINRGEIVGIVGESGSGKSLTSRTILKLLPEGGEVVSGKILFHNKDLLHLATLCILNDTLKVALETIRHPYNYLNQINLMVAI